MSETHEDMSKLGDQFQLADPMEAFLGHAKQEIERLQQTDPKFDQPLYDEALQMVNQRLSLRLKAAQNHDHS
ncbi:hypothetical protein [Magnetococcus sp. PR-3]|uniref:hypothetical protein n=1 Tax=Magnetococcus sp. PR-3 TaxID=3120355 RepID=UPI002FCE2EF7